MPGAHDEELHAECDVLLRFPVMPLSCIAVTASGSVVWHQPQRDNALARLLCPMLTDGRSAARSAAALRNAIDCVAAM